MQVGLDLSLQALDESVQFILLLVAHPFQISSDASRAASICGDTIFLILAFNVPTDLKVLVLQSYVPEYQIILTAKNVSGIFKLLHVIHMQVVIHIEVPTWILNHQIIIHCNIKQADNPPLDARHCTATDF